MYLRCPSLRFTTPSHLSWPQALVRAVASALAAAPGVALLYLSEPALHQRCRRTVRVSSFRTCALLVAARVQWLPFRILRKY
jgi:hypothetical protein